MSNKGRRKGRGPAHPPPPSAARQITVTEESRSFSGPLPAPEVLQQYGDIVSDAPERILRMAEHNGQYLRELGMQALTSERRERRLGQWLGFSIGIAALGTASFCAWQGQGIAAAIIGGATLASLVTVFVTGRSK